jgi:hypothetical protein
MAEGNACWRHCQQPVRDVRCDNQKVAEISGQVGLTPQAWNGSIFNMIQSLSETVIVHCRCNSRFVMTLELIQLITDKNI